MNKPETKKLYRRAVSKWGHKFQLIMLMEELAELIQATSKVLRKGDKETSVWRDFVEEMADVEIMIEQIKYVTSWENLIERIKTAKHDKLLRLKSMLDEE